MGAKARNPALEAETAIDIVKSKYTILYYTIYYIMSLPVNVSEAPIFFPCSPAAHAYRRFLFSMYVSYGCDMNSENIFRFVVKPQSILLKTTFQRFPFFRLKFSKNKILHL